MVTLNGPDRRVAYSGVHMILIVQTLTGEKITSAQNWRLKT